jgi:hypothetical protein
MLPQKFSAATTKKFPFVPLDPPDGAADPLSDDAPVAAALEEDPVALEDELELPHALSPMETTIHSTSMGRRSE